MTFNPDEARDDHGRWTSIGAGDFTSEELDALRGHAGMDYVATNSYLRGTKLGGREIDQGLALYAKENVAKIDSAMAKSAMTKDATVYRSIRQQGWYDIHGQDLKVGDVITDKGFVSTSRDLETVNKMPQHATAEISVPKGYPAVDIEDLDRLFQGHVAAPDTLRTEHEILLNRGTRFEVTAVNKNATWFGTGKPDVVLKVLK